MLELLALVLIAASVGLGLDPTPEGRSDPSRLARRASAGVVLLLATVLLIDRSAPLSGLIHALAALMALGSLRCVLGPLLLADWSARPSSSRE